jgi:hypothetical protein
MKLLLAEDDAMLGTSMERGLALAGFKVDWFRTGQHATSALATQTYDVVLLDIGLPDIDGLQILRRTRGVMAAMPDRVAGFGSTTTTSFDRTSSPPSTLARRQPSHPHWMAGRPIGAALLANRWPCHANSTCCVRQKPAHLGGQLSSTAEDGVASNAVVHLLRRNSANPGSAACAAWLVVVRGCCCGELVCADAHLGSFRQARADRTNRAAPR